MKKIMLFGFFALALGLCSNQVSQGTKGTDNTNAKLTMVLTLDCELSDPIPLNPGIFGKRLCAIRVETKLASEAGALGKHETNPADGQPLQAEDSHVIEFYEFREGLTGVHESKSADDGFPPLLASLQGEKTLTEMFCILCPDKAVPQSLIDADERAACAKVQITPASKDTPNKAPSALPLSTDRMNTTPGCSPDYYHDGWGAGWFFWNFSPAGRYKDWGFNRSLVNWYTPDDVSAIWWNSMNGDFFMKQNTKGYYRWCCYDMFWWLDCCYWLEMWDFDIPPRYLHSWNWTSGSWSYLMYLFNNCGHAHFTVGWNE